MTSPTAEPVVAPAVKPASRWEDFMDIFYAPSTVYERRQNQSPWPTILIVTLLITIVTIVTFNAMSPAYESEIRQMMAKTMAKSPQITQDMVDKQIPMQLTFRKYATVFFPIGVLIIAVFVWIAAKLVGAKLNYAGALTVIAYAGIIAVVGTIVVDAQALVLDVS